MTAMAIAADLQQMTMTAAVHLRKNARTMTVANRPRMMTTVRAHAAQEPPKSPTIAAAAMEALLSPKTKMMRKLQVDVTDVNRERKKDAMVGQDS